MGGAACLSRKYSAWCRVLASAYRCREPLLGTDLAAMQGYIFTTQKSLWLLLVQNCLCSGHHQPLGKTWGGLLGYGPWVVACVAADRLPVPGLHRRSCDCLRNAGRACLHLSGPPHNCNIERGCPRGYLWRDPGTRAAPGARSPWTCCGRPSYRTASPSSGAALVARSRQKKKAGGTHLQISGVALLSR